MYAMQTTDTPYLGSARPKILMLYRALLELEYDLQPYNHDGADIVSETT